MSKQFPDGALPDDVLKALAEEHPDTTVVTQAGVSGYTILWLMSHYTGPTTVPWHVRLCDPDLCHPLLSVREPGHGWPVPVVRHYSANPSIRQIDYDLCGPHHNPNRHRLGIDDTKAPTSGAKSPLEAIAIAEAHLAEIKRELEHQQQQLPIDTPQKLYDLCRALLAGETPASAGHTAAVKARAARHARRAAPPAHKPA